MVRHRLVKKHSNLTRNSSVNSILAELERKLSEEAQKHEVLARREQWLQAEAQLAKEKRAQILKEREERARNLSKEISHSAVDITLEGWSPKKWEEESKKMRKDFAKDV